MKFVRYGPKGKEIPGVIDSTGTLYSLADVVKDIDGDALANDLPARVRSIGWNALPEVTTPPEGGWRWGSCIARPGKFVGIGLNYADHAREAGLPIPTEPIIFLKASSSISGPTDPIIKPPHSTKLDWEVELGVVIGKTARHVNVDEALSYVAGYCVVNDVSERNFQMERGGTWDKGKGYDSFGPTGPWLVTPDEVPDPQALTLWLDVNGNRAQSGSTATMIFNVAQIISYVSEYMTLEPGDLITTGTPPGVGMGFKPPVFLDVGDVLTLGIEGLGSQRQEVVAWSR